MTYKIRYPCLGLNGSRIERDLTVKKRAEAIEFAYQNADVGLKLLQKDPTTKKWIEFHRSTYCRRCGRALTDPKSVANGIGPECIKHVNTNISHLKDYQKRINDYLSMIEGTVTLSQDAVSFIQPHIDMDRFQHCHAELPLNLVAYPHDGGLTLPGYPEKMWVYVVCPTCGYQLSWHHFWKREE